MGHIYVSKYCILTKKYWNISAFPDKNAVYHVEVDYNAIYGINDLYYPAPYPGHKGTDYLVPKGQAIYGLNGFHVLGINHLKKALGNHVEISNDVICFTVAHLDSILVYEGQYVDENTILGYSGNTGVSQGPHLHVQAWLNELGAWVDATPYMSGTKEIPYPIYENQAEFLQETDVIQLYPLIPEAVGFTCAAETIQAIYDEEGTYYFTKRNNNPVYHSLTDAFFDRNVVATYTVDESVKYQRIVDTNLYRYIVYVGASGNTCYLPVYNHCTGWQAGYAV